ncbi:MAG: alpha-amylase family glycosyl hydrolase, partial [Planctomycetota bacterium]
MDAPTEFHVSRKSRDRYGILDSLFAPSGRAPKGGFHGARLLALKMNEERREAGPARESELNALGLLHAVFHRVIGLYRQTIRPGVLQDIRSALVEELGEDSLDRLLAAFLEAFPSASIYRGEASTIKHLSGRTGGLDNGLLLVEELLVLWVMNRNPALAPYAELLDESELAKSGDYARAVVTIRKLFERLPSFGPEEVSLVEMLMGPARAVPDSLAGQLEHVRGKWGYLLGEFLSLLLRAADLFREETKWGSPRAGAAAVMDYGSLEEEPERFSPDRDWMPNVVIMAKNVHVWLHQLCRRYGRDVGGLDGIPDEELDRLARWGFTGLWLIGLWERSPASRTIKHLCGNPEAMASAYSIHEYEIAGDLGGDGAFENLKERCIARGIRMATDMVPNHMGIDSPWVVEHPQRFLSLAESPYPVYRFGGEDLSSGESVSIFIESGYFDRTDAAVVFKRVDRPSGAERFIYHGNDGTSMPWNDTAQLDYMNPETREAVIREILGVAKKSPIIRFDAAMTLTRRHYQRLWFPEPGSGGAIPSRAEKGLSREEFLKSMPAEFWREVVDRVKEEAPDTLLL